MTLTWRCSDMEASKLLTDLQRQGFTLTPLPDGKLEVRPASKLIEVLRATLKQRKAEVLVLLSQRPRPYLTPDGELIIPFACDPCYHWWAGRMSVAEILMELNAPSEVWRRYVAGYTETRQ